MTSKSMITPKQQSLPFKPVCKTTPYLPHPYQKKAIKWLLEHAAAGLFLDPGLGKTAITLAACKILKNEGLMEKALIIAPLRVCYNVWPNEIAKWAEFSHFTFAVLHGDKKNEKLHEDVDFYIINPEGLTWLFQDPKRLKKLGIDTLIIDESSKFKHPNIGRFKTLKQHLGKFSRRWILTGSPASNGLMDLFGQIYILDLGNALSPYITHFRQRFFTPSGFGGYDWKLKEGGEAEINAAVKPLILRLDAADYLDLPKIIENNIMVTLPPAARKLYDKMEDQLIADIESRVVTALSAAAASVKCRQIASGGLYFNDEEAASAATKSDTWHHVHDEKTNVITDLVEELQGQPLLIGYEFQHDLWRLQKALGKSVAYLGAGVSAKRSTEIIAAWNNDELPVLLGQPQSMGHGLNLQGGACNTVAWYSLTWNFELYDQFIKRVARQGSRHKTIMVHRVLAADTIDEAQAFALKKKKVVQSAFLDAMREYIVKRRK